MVAPNEKHKRSCRSMKKQCINNVKSNLIATKHNKRTMPAIVVLCNVRHILFILLSNR